MRLETILWAREGYEHVGQVYWRKRRCEGCLCTLIGWGDKEMKKVSIQIYIDANEWPGSVR